MKNMNWKIEEHIQDDIAKINQILESSDLTDLRVRMSLFQGIRKGAVFQSAFGDAFLDSLISDELYDDPEAAEQIKRDLAAFERIAVYIQSNDGVQVVERMKKYQFRCDWIKQFAAEYLDGYCLGAPVIDGYLAELSDLDLIRRLVKIGNSRESFRYDEVYALMEQQKDKEQFRSWIGKFFQESVRVHTTQYQKKEQLKKKLILLGLILSSLLLGLLFSCVLIAVR